MFKQAYKINATLLFDAKNDQMQEFPHSENVIWLWQFYPEAHLFHSYLIEGDETYPTRIWQKRNPRTTIKVHTKFELVWECPQEVSND